VKPRGRGGRWTFTLGIFAATLVFRLATQGGLENDHFVALARAHQVLRGDLPVRDFFDPGMPLTYLSSAAAAAIFGRTLLVDTLLHIGVLAVATALLFRVSLAACGSTAIAFAVVAIQLVADPRLYNVPKVLVHVAAIALAWSYANRPTSGRIAALGAWTGLAFLVRHDHAIYIAVATAALLLAIHAHAWHLLWRRLAWFGTVAAAVASPWLLYVHWAAGLPGYVSAALAFSRAEAQRTAGTVPGLEGGGLLFYGCLLMSGAAVVLARRRAPARLPHVTFAALLLACLTAAFLRDAIWARVPEVAGIAGLVAVWTLTLVVPRPVAGGAIIAVLLLTAHATGFLGAAISPTVPLAARRAAGGIARIVRAETPFRPDSPLEPIVSYIRTCTSAGDRILTTGFAPELPVLADRAFAGGLPAWLPGYYERDQDQRQAIRRMRDESVPVLVMTERDTDLAASWPLLDGYLATQRYHRYAATAGDRPVTLAVRSPSPDAIHQETGVPCPEPPVAR
jgi:hypothetical protein